MIKEFECKKCGNVLEVWERFDEKPEFCEKCGGELNRVLSKSSFHLKGNGWARDGYGLKSSKNKK